MRRRQRKLVKKKKQTEEQSVPKPETELHVESHETIIRENAEEAQGIKGIGK